MVLIFKGNCDFLNIGSWLRRQFLTIHGWYSAITNKEAWHLWSNTDILHLNEFSAFPSKYLYGHELQRLLSCLFLIQLFLKNLRRKRDLSTSVFDSIMASNCSMMEKGRSALLFISGHEWSRIPKQTLTNTLCAWEAAMCASNFYQSPFCVIKTASGSLSQLRLIVRRLNEVIYVPTSQTIVHVRESFYSAFFCLTQWAEHEVNFSSFPVDSEHCVEFFASEVKITISDQKWRKSLKNWLEAWNCSCTTKEDSMAMETPSVYH